MMDFMMTHVVSPRLGMRIITSVRVVPHHQRLAALTMILDLVRTRLEKPGIFLHTLLAIVTFVLGANVTLWAVAAIHMIEGLTCHLQDLHHSKVAQSTPDQKAETTGGLATLHHERHKAAQKRKSYSTTYADMA